MSTNERLATSQLGFDDSSAGATTERVGMLPDRSKLEAARSIAWSVAAGGFFVVGPSVIQLVMDLKQGPIDEPARWLYVLFFLGGLHLLYSVYLLQLPDWSSMWVLSTVMLVFACIDSIVLGGLLLGGGEGLVAGALQLESERRSQAMIWTVCMLSVHGLLAYFCGREAMRWQKTFQSYVELLGPSPKSIASPESVSR